MSSFEAYKSEDYKVEVEPIGREGNIFYIEQSRLPFYWEILGTTKGGIGVTIPTPKEWDNYCERNKADWAKGRRDEIVQRIAQSLVKGWYRRGSFEIEQDTWLNIYPAPTLITRLLNKLGLK